MTAYRPEIDGLRAVAVLAVLFFHLDISLFKGGFAGVDVFFVISGYLITSIIAEQLQQGSFTLAEFYERRARRIMPALTVVCAACLGVAATLFYTDDTLEISSSVIATMIFASNIFFWSVTGYFATDVDEKPLLHTWSLGVEEQFYIVLPLLLMVLYRRGSGRTGLVVLVLAALSLVLAEYGVRHWPNAAFYLLPFRFWELAIGALLALGMVPQIKQAQAYNYLAGGGLLLVMISVLSLSESSFPGVSALMPCVGAALILYAGAKSPWMTKTLARRPVVFTGKISYSLYLWHWPVLAVANYCYEDASGIIAKILITVVSFGLAALSWRFVEMPFRNRAFLSRTTIFGLTGVVMILLIGAADLLIAQKGLPQRFSPEIATARNAKFDQPVFIHEDCLPQAGKPVPEKCLFGDKGADKITAVIWGDSHASAFVPALEALLQAKGIKAIAQTRNSCPGFAGVYEWDAKDFGVCRDFNTQVYDWLIANPDVRTVVLAGRWNSIARKFAKDEGEATEKFTAALHQTARLLREHGKQVFFVAPVPEPGFDVPRCVARQLQFGDSAFPCSPLTQSSYLEGYTVSLSAFTDLSRSVPVFFPGEMCQGGVCPIVKDGRILFFDDDHLSVTGAQDLSAGVEATFGASLQSPHDK